VCVQCGNGLTVIEALVAPGCMCRDQRVMYMHHYQLSSEQYKHADLKVDLERGSCFSVLSVRRQGCALDAVVMVWLQGLRTRAHRACLPHSRGTLFHTSKVSSVHGVWGQDKVVSWLWPGHLWDAGGQSLLSLASARSCHRESGGRGCTMATWQAGTGLNMPHACLEVFGRCDERLPSVVPVWICNLKRCAIGVPWPRPRCGRHDIASAPQLGYPALKTNEMYG
jgi:hypothetical protein